MSRTEASLPSIPPVMPSDIPPVTFGKNTPSRVLIVEDDPALARVVQRVLRAAGYETVCASDGSAAIEQFRVARFDLIITDLSMPNMDGLELLRAVRQIDLDVPVVICTAAPGVDSAMRAIEYGALRYLQKPIRNEELVEVAHHAVTLHELARIKRRALALMEDPTHAIGDLAGLEGSFQNALDRLFMCFQPIVSWSTQSVIGFEALVRSRDPRMSSPAVLFDAANRLGRAHDLGRRIRQLSPLHFQDNQHKLFINVDAKDLDDDTLFDTSSPLAQMADRVVIELTERVSLDHIKDANARVAALHKMGYQIAIDDLGAGYAGLSYFGALEPDLCKLDMQLVRDIDTSKSKRAIVAGMARMCRDLGITLICEGIETRAERDCLIELGCDAFQGYLFARPGATLPVIDW